MGLGRRLVLPMLLDVQEMKLALSLFTICFVWLSGVADAQSKPHPDINESSEFPGVFHSPSAESTPSVFRSVLNMEIVITAGNGDAEVRYANGVVLSRSGLIVSVLDGPASTISGENIQSTTILMLDGGAVEAELVKFDASHGLGVFRTEGLSLPALELSTARLVSKRRLNWHTVFNSGRKVFLYSRPLQVHKGEATVGQVDDLCEIIDQGSSSLTADRSGSALLSLDGRLVAVMGRQPHWNVSPKSVHPRTKTAWAVPAHVIAQLIADKDFD